MSYSSRILTAAPGVPRCRTIPAQTKLHRVPSAVHFYPVTLCVNTTWQSLESFNLYRLASQRLSGFDFINLGLLSDRHPDKRQEVRLLQGPRTTLPVQTGRRWSHPWLGWRCSSGKWSFEFWILINVMLNTWKYVRCLRFGNSSESFPPQK